MSSHTISNFLSSLVCILLGLLIAVVLLSAFMTKNLHQAGSKDAADKAPRVLKVRTLEVIPNDSYSVTRNFSGAIQARKTVNLGFGKPGVIRTFRADPGETVSQGDVLATQNQGEVLKAPFMATVASRMASEGAFVNPGQPVIRLIDTAQLEIHIGVPLEIAAELKKGDEEWLVVGEEAYKAAVLGVSPEVDPGGRSRTLFFELPERVSQKLLPGEIARLELNRTVDGDGAWVPLAALSRETRGLWSVFAVLKDADGISRAERLFVEVIHVENDKARVVGLVGDRFRVISEGLHRIVPGQQIEISDEEPAALIE